MSNAESGDGGPLEAILEEYLDDLADGGKPDQKSYLQRFPELANELKGVFRTLEFVEATGRSLDGARLQHGAVLGDFRIVRETARGGMGVVYEAVQISLGRRVALKVLPAGALLSETAAERFSREAATAGRLQHTNIVPVYGIGQAQGIHYYAMQFIEGRSLADHLRRLRDESIHPGNDWHKRVSHWGRQIAEALDYAHTEGIIHRDIKPSNLLLDARDNVWITDFGLARTDALASITLTGDVIGTARYMSPEQARGGRQQLDRRTDIYSLGVTLYELLTLKPAYDGESRQEVLSQVAFRDPPALRDLDGTIPKDLATIVGKCMSKNPADRYLMARDVAEDFRRFLAGESILARRTPLWVRAGRYCRKNRFRLLAMAGIGLLICLSMLLFMKMREDRGYACLDQARTNILHEWDLVEAQRLLDEATRLGVQSADLDYYNGLLKLFSGDPYSAIPILEKALSQNPESVEIEYALTSSYVATGDVFNGKRHLKQIADREVDTPLGWLLRGQVLNVLEMDGVLESYEKAIELRPNFSRAISAKGLYRSMKLLVEGDRSQLEPMLNDFDACVTFQPNRGTVRADRAMVRLSTIAYAGTQNDMASYLPSWVQQCRQDFDEAVRLTHGESRAVLVRLGVFERFIGEFEKSAETFGTAIRLSQQEMGLDNPAFVHHRCISLHAAGEIQQALDEIEPVCEVSPRIYPLQNHRILLLDAVGQHEKARSEGLALLDSCITDYMGLVLTGPVVLSLGERDAVRNAVEAFRESQAASGNPLPVLDYLAGDIDADGLLEWAGDHPGHQCEAHFILAMDARGRGDNDLARIHLQRCLDTGVYVYVQFRYAQALTGIGGLKE